MHAAPFDALVAAYEPGPGPGALRALVPVAGRPLVEHQLRRLAAAGAGRLLLLVDEVSPELAEVVTLLKREGLALEPVAGLDVAAAALSADRPCLLLADACLPEEELLRRMGAAPSPLLACLPDTPALERYERMDADTRWAGVALLDGARVAAAAAMLGSWDPVSTLLRRAVQEGAARLDASGQPPVLLLDPSEQADADARIVEAARPHPRDWAARWVEAPLLSRIVPRLVERGTAPEWLAVPAGLAALLGGVLALAGWRWPPLLLLLAASPLRAAGRQLARIVDRPLIGGWLLRVIDRLAGLVAVVGLSAGLMRGTGQWGWCLTGALLIVAVLLAVPLRAAAPRPVPLWLATRRTLAWALLPFACLGRWDWGLAALAAYAAASFGFLYTRLAAQAAADAGLPPPKLF